MKKQILVFGKHPEIMEVVLRLLRNSGLYEAEGGFTVAEVQDRASQQAFDLLLLGGGVSSSENAEVHQHFQERGIRLPIIQHFGGGSGLLFAEIQEALRGS
jgi:DNA-binding NtrC family response regulator